MTNASTVPASILSTETLGEFRVVTMRTRFNTTEFFVVAEKYPAAPALFQTAAYDALLKWLDDHGAFLTDDPEPRIVSYQEFRELTTDPEGA